MKLELGPVNTENVRVEYGPLAVSGLALSVDARLSSRRPDGSVMGSYSADVMAQLLR